MGFSPGNHRQNGIALKRASEQGGSPSGMPMQKRGRVAGWRCFQGDFLSVSLPTHQGLGYSLFVLRAIGIHTRKCREVRSSRNPDPGLIIRLRRDLVVALRQRERWAEAVAGAQHLRADRDRIPAYVAGFLGICAAQGIAPHARFRDLYHPFR
jgi:hypothetical protein